MQDELEFDIPVYIIKQCLVIPVQADLYNDYIFQLKKTVLERLNNAYIIGIVIDISAIKVIDSIELQSILDIYKLTHLMGKRSVIIGTQAAVAAAMAEFLDINLNKIVIFRNLDTAIRYLRARNQRQSTLNHSSIGK